MKNALDKFPKLTAQQRNIIERIIEGSTIFVDRTNIEKIEYSLCDDLGNVEFIGFRTFNSLEKSGLIKHKQSPYVDVEMWS